MTDIRAIEQIRERLEAAENAGNADDIVAMLAEDVVLMVPDQPVQEGKTTCSVFVRDVLSGLLAHFDRQIRYVSAEVKVLGDVAFDRGAFSFTVAPKDGGDTDYVTGKYLWLLTRENAMWKMARVIVSLDENHEEED
jgi:uncharacterized protein (TIGR02246 family)